MGAVELNSEQHSVAPPSPPTHLNTAVGAVRSDLARGHPVEEAVVAHRHAVVLVRRLVPGVAVPSQVDRTGRGRNREGDLV